MKWKLAAFLLLIILDAKAQFPFQPFETLGVDDGLSQSSVYSLYQDSRGFLWIGTADGLNRYDGQSIKVFRAPQNVSEPFNSNFIRGNIGEDDKSNLWYYTENGLYQYNRSTNKVEKKFVPSDPAIIRAEFKVVTIDELQRVWLFNPVLGFSFFDINSGLFKSFPYPSGLKSKNIFHSFVTIEDSINFWCSINQGEDLFRFNIHTLKYTPWFEGQHISLLQFVRRGFYSVIYNEIYFYDSILNIKKKVPVVLPQTSLIVQILEDKWHRLWIATMKDGLWLFDGATQQTFAFKHQPGNNSSIETDQLTGILIDQRDNLWISTEGGGICKIDIKDPAFKSSLNSQMQKLKTGLFVKSIFEDSKNNIWIGSFLNQIYLLNLNTGLINAHSKPDLLEIKSATVIKEDQNKNIWIGHENKITKIDSTGKILARVTFNTSNIYFLHNLVQLLNGQMLAATADGILVIEQNRKELICKELIHICNVQDIVETSQGQLWFGLKNIGLRCMSMEKPNQLEGAFLQNLDIKSIHKDIGNSDILWLGSDKGLVRFDTHTKLHRLYTEADGMANCYVYGILEDLAGNLWFSTNGGISCFNKEQNKFTNYTSKDGLQSNEFNTGAFHRGRSGNLYFGGIKGVNWFDPSSFRKNQNPPATTITEILVNDVSLSDSLVHSLSIDLPYYENDLKIKFAVFDFTLPKSNKIKYQLLGLDDRERSSNQLEVAYNNLPPGNYRLIFSGSSLSGPWSKEKMIFINIIPPFWKRWWFYALSISLSVAGIALLAWYITRQRYKTKIVELEKQNALELERRRIGMEMHDDIGANLTRIALISESAKHKAEKDNSLDQIAQTSRQAVSAMGEIIWSLNPDNRSFGQLMAYVREQLHELLEATDISYTIDLPDGDFLLSSPLKRNIILLMKESVNNAIKHSNASEIRVQGELANRWFIATVSDNGKGFDGKAHQGNGIKNMKIRTEEIKGDFEIKTENNQGATLFFRIPMN